MHITVQAMDSIITHTLRASIEDRLASALAWSGRNVSKLIVMLSKQSGPQGELLQFCRIHARLADGRELVVEDGQLDIKHAMERAASRVDRLLRQVRKHRAILQTV